MQNIYLFQDMHQQIDDNEDGKTDVIAYDFNEDGEWDKFENV